MYPALDACGLHLTKTVNHNLGRMVSVTAVFNKGIMWVHLVNHTVEHSASNSDDTEKYGTAPSTITCEHYGSLIEYTSLVAC